MANFFWRAKKASGEEISGQRDSIDRFSLARELRTEGLIALAIEETEQSKTRAGGKKSWFKFNITLGRVSMKDKIIFANNLSAMIGAGLPLSRALSVMARQTNRKYFKKIISEVEAFITKGESLSRALANWPKVFPEVFVAMVAAAEETGRLPEALKLVSEQLEKSYALRRKIVGAMIYPSVIVAAIITIGILMMIFLIPTLSATFRELNVPLPLSTQIVMGLSDFLVNNILLVLAGLALLVVIFVSLPKTIAGKKFLDKVLLHLPFINNLTRQVNSAVIMRTVSSLVSAGVSLTKTMEVTEKVVQNYYYKQVMVEALVKVQKGIPLSVIFSAHQNLFPIFASEMSAVGEETGKMPEMLLKGALFFEDEVDQVTKNLSTVIEPVLMIVIGIAVGFFAISMIGPMYSLSNAIK
ncbi:MAG: type II secretion system F family protein [Candidatus Paceibacterota bacterium]|jgi:type IV pilus assembly protein PilC